ncbi:TonB-dependent receptor [Phenylobacterium sp.]|uniref:TonB-dependent receptor n=1 Tax=Phenylobacterium sp. TaxID=1871053 RepID=UPI002FC906A9
MKTLPLLASTSLLALFVAGAAQAQTTAEGSAVEEVIVTAQKRAENLQDVPISIAAVPATALERGGVQTIDGLQRLAPGLNISAIGSGFVSYTYIRGAGTNVIDSGSDPSVAYFMDEVYLAGTAGLQSDLLDVERIEVLKGPQGTLFGRNAAAGAISIVSKRPEGAFNAYASADAGNHDFLAVRGGVTGPLTADGAWRFRLAGAHRERGAYTTNPAGRDPGDIDNYTARGQVEYQGETLLFRLSGDLFSSDNGMTNHFLSTAAVTGFLSPEAGARLPTDQSFFRRYYNVDGFEKQDTRSLTARIEYELPFATLTAITGWRDNQFKRLQDQDGSLADGYALGTDQNDITISQELRLSADSGPLRWIGGLYFYHGMTDRRDTIDSGPDFAVPVLRSSLGTYGQNIDTKSYAIFGQATYEVTEQLSLTVGGRYTKDKKVSDQATDPFGPAGAYFVRLTPSWDSFDPALTVEYDATQDIMIYASARQGFKSGGFQSLPGSLTLASTVYDPERVRAYELGAKTQWWDDRLTANVALFRADIDDQQILRIPSAGLTIIDNAGKTRTKGVDIALSARPVPALRVDFNATIQHARFREYLSNGVSFAGKHQLRSPDRQISIVAEYTVPVGEAGDILLHGEYAYQSKVFFDAANTSSMNANQPGYGLVGGRIIFRPAKGDWDFAVWGKNLADKRYFRNVAISGPSGLGTPGDPLTYGVSVNWRLR